MQEIKIRDVQEKDASKLADLMGQLGYPVSLEDMLDRIKFYQTNQAYFTCVAEMNSSVIGSISVAIINYFHRKGLFARIIAMIVDENYRNQGVGKMLVKHTEEMIKKFNCDFIELTSGTRREGSGSHEFYLSLGYHDAKDKKKYFVKPI